MPHAGDTVRLCRIANRGTPAESLELNVNAAYYYPVTPSPNAHFPWGTFASPLSAPVGVPAADVSANTICWPLLLLSIVMVGDWTRLHPLVSPRWPYYNPVSDPHGYHILLALVAFDRVTFNDVARD